MENLERIKKFLHRENAVPIFRRAYGLQYLLAIYEAYRRQIEKEAGVKIDDVVAYYDSEAKLYSFFVDFTCFNSALVEALNSERALSFYGLVTDYYQLLEERNKIEEKSVKKEEKEVFQLSARILALEALSFIVPFLAEDLKMPINDKELINKFSRARLDSEKEFSPSGPLDNFLSSIEYIPANYSNYKKTDQDFVLFEDGFYYEQDFIDEFKKIVEDKLKSYAQETIKGMVAYSGKNKIIGKVKIILSQKDFNRFEDQEILVASGTTPDYLPLIRRAKAIITDEGGILCHAAIVSREFKIPCLVGTMVTTKVLKDGDEIEIDLEKGIVRKIK